jgi:DNA-binding transcriptional LysR family regulator
MTDKTVQRLRLTLRQLEVFVATAREGSTRGGAGSVARSQSAASAALADLEGVLGVQVFDRLGRRLVLNENGRALLPRAAALLEQGTELQGLFDEIHAAPLRLAASYTLGEYVLPPLIASWKAHNPRSPARLAISNSSDVLRALLALEADVGFIESPRTHAELHVRQWSYDALVIVAAPDHPLARRAATRRQLAAAPWVLREAGSGTRDASDRWLLPALGEVDVSLELGSNEAVKRAVRAGLGLGCLSRHAVEEALAQGALVEVRSPLAPFRRPLAVVVHKSRPLGSVAQGFIRHCLAAAR